MNTKPLNPLQQRMLESAIDYALDKRWRVLPVSKHKKPLIERWTELATTDEKQIVNWWLRYPNANIGIATGAESGIFVVDCDEKDGVSGVHALAEHFGERFVFDADKHLAGKTPTGGVHLVFQWDEAHPVKTTAGVLPGVDLRGTGGQVVVAPSARHINGEWIEYRWNDLSLPICEMLDWVRELTSASIPSSGKPLDLTRVMTGLEEGERDAHLYKYACHLRAKEVPFGIAIGFVKAAARLCQPPFDEAEAVKKVEDAYTRYEDAHKKRALRTPFWKRR
ncbi:MAG: bifunctional DNA primase/polymerase [Gammaproteobacteria bacterium]